MEKLAVERSVWVAVSLERAWRAVTEPKQLERWYAVGCPWEIPTLQVGATVKFYNTDTDIQQATITVVDPPSQFALRWSEQGLLTAFRLEEENEGTRVTILETGYEALPEAERQQWVDDTYEGYGMSLENLKTYLEAI